MSLADVITAMPLAVTPVTPGYPAEVTEKTYTNHDGYPSYPGYPAKHQNPSDYDTAERAAIQWESELPPFEDPSGCGSVPGFGGMLDLTPAQHGAILKELMEEYSQ